MGAGNLRGELLGGKYRLGDVIGTGGMGVVYEATHTELRIPCAVKVVHPALGDPAHSRRLLREARVLAELSGPHAVRVLDAGRLSTGATYLVMERLSGHPLSELLRQEKRLECTRAVDFARQICAAVGEAHARGIVHRDLKPSNVFVVAPDCVKVLDFGLATRFGALRDDSTATGSEFAGSPRYMSPEQIRASAAVTPSTDIWSLAVLLFEMLTGRLPFEAPNTGALLASIVADPATRLREIVPDAPPELDRLLADCLEKNPRQRPPNVECVGARLRSVREGASLGLLAVAGDSATRGPGGEQATVSSGPRGDLAISRRGRARTLSVGMFAAAALLLAFATEADPNRSHSAPAPADTPAASPRRKPALPPIAHSPDAGAIQRFDAAASHLSWATEGLEACFLFNDSAADIQAVPTRQLPTGSSAHLYPSSTELALVCFGGVGEPAVAFTRVP